MPKTQAKATTRRNALPEPQAFYITTDLLVSSRASLVPLAAALPDAHLAMARLLVLNGRSRGSVETAFRRFIARLSALRGAALRSWQTAGRRVLDIGIQASNDTRPFEGVRLSAATLKAVAALGVQIQVTVTDLVRTIGVSARQRVLFVAHEYRRVDRVRLISARRATPSETHAYQESRR